MLTGRSIFSMTLQLESTCIGITKNGDKYWKLAGLHRNELMAKEADACIVFWDGKSTGTKNMIDLAKKYKLKLRVINI